MTKHRVAQSALAPIFLSNKKTHVSARALERLWRFALRRRQRRRRSQRSGQRASWRVVRRIRTARQQLKKLSAQPEKSGGSYQKKSVQTGSLAVCLLAVRRVR